MHKINYEEFFKIKDRNEFENEYLIELGFKEYNNGELVFTEKYIKLNLLYQNIFRIFLKMQFASKLPSSLVGIILAPYDTLVDLFFEINNLSKDFINKVEEIYNYDKYYKKYGKYSEHIRSFFCKYADKLNLYSCAYCECSYTGVFNDSGNKNKGIFDLDHFFPKSAYPLFALSLYNFVPCCNICNSRVKSSNSFLSFFNIEIGCRNSAKQMLLKLSPASEDYNFQEETLISYIPKLEKVEKSDKECSPDIITYKTWHYTPLARVSAEMYKPFFDTEFSNDVMLLENTKSTRMIISSMQLETRYDSIAIKNKGLFFLDLKKRYPESHLQMLSNLLMKSNYYISPEEIEKEVFHIEEKYNLLEKLKNDLLE